MEAEQTFEQTSTTPRARHPNYVGVFLLLGVITLVEIAAAQFLVRSAAKVPMLLFLAGVKAALVALYYMHLKFDSRIFAFFFSAAIFLLAVPFIIILLTLGRPEAGSAGPPVQGETQHQGGGAQGGGQPGGAPTGGGQHAGGNQGPQPPTNIEALSFATNALDTFRFEPNTITAKPGQTVNVTFKNVGVLQHSFVLQQTNTKIVADGGKTATGNFVAPPPGTYTFICDVPGHAPAGMQGQLIVQ